MSVSRRRRFIINAVYFAIVAGLVFLAFRYLLGFLWPFVAAFVFAWCLRPAIRRLVGRVRMPYKLAAGLCLFGFFVVMGCLVFLIGRGLFSLGAGLVRSLPALYEDSIAPGLESLSASVRALADELGPEVSALADRVLPNLMSSAASGAASLSMSLASGLTGAAAGLPRAVLSLLVCVIATIFLALDFDRVTAFVMYQLPERTRHVVRHAKNTFVTVVTQYVKSYGLIMLITFAEVLAALLLLGQRHAVLIAGAVAVFDILPVVGAWMALVPWAIVELMAGNMKMGVGLLILWLVEAVVRQIIEPRIVGFHVGLHPVVTLLAMYVGSKLFGGVGLFGLPITCAILYSLDRAGVIHILRRADEPAPPEPTTGAAGD